MTIDTQMNDELTEERGELPEGWAETTLGEVGSLRLGKILDRTKNQGDLVPYLRSVNVRWFTFDLTDLQELRVSLQEREVLSVRDGDVFICEGDEPGRAAVWRGGSNALVYQKALHRFRPSPAVLAELLTYRLKHDAFTGQLSKAFTGTTIKHLPGEKLAAYSLVLPPLPEQIRIADKLDALLARVDAGRERLERVPKLVKQFRQAVLSAAVNGELTREWRGGGEAEWQPTSIAELATDIRYGTSQKCDYDASGVPVLRIPNVSGGRINTDDMKYGKFEETERRKLSLQTGDILMIRSNGSADLVGQPSLVEEQHQGFLFADYLIGVRLSQQVNPGFIWHCL